MIINKIIKIEYKIDVLTNENNRFYVKEPIDKIINFDDILNNIGYFSINDEEIPKIKKTQLSLYDQIHNIHYKNENKKKPEEKDKYRDIEIKYSKPIKEYLMYKDKGNNWECKFCKKINEETIKFCEFCFNRLFIFL